MPTADLSTHDRLVSRKEALVKNPAMEAFMAQFPQQGLTFDDVSLVTAYADFLPDETDLSTKLSRNIDLGVPFVSAAMDTVSEADMAIAMALQGGIGVIHKNLTPAAQAAEVSRVKHYLNGLISDPVTFPHNIQVRELLAIREEKEYQFAGFPILDDKGCLVGILTSRDIRFLTDLDVAVSDVMTTDLLLGSPGTTIREAFDTMRKHKVGKLPIVDQDGRLLGLYSFSDVKTIIENMEPTFNRDGNHRLRVAAAVGPNDHERFEQLAAQDVDAMVIDTSHGHSKGVIETVRFLKGNYPDIEVIAGNIATGEGASALVEAGADAVKVGIGPGSICTTRVIAGVGVPQITAVYEVSRAVGDTVPVIADGGIAYSGDAAKALAAGADALMMGSVLAGTEESPGETILHQGRTYVAYRGMGSLDAMRSGKGSRERYGQQNILDPDKLVPQGIEGLIPYRGKVADVLHQYAGGLRFALGYCGVRTIPDFQRRARFVRISSASLREAHPHDIKIIKDAPNYRSSS